ncbi:MAG: DUF362 domain-containing protein [Candidatus Altiarchaeota archaeon]|nr:DUF362 domain-containing protein [Candidatus Altiarchaeota archaeon]
MEDIVQIADYKDYKNTRFIKAFVKKTGLKGKKVLVKPNLLLPALPEKAVTTHPSIVKAVVEKLLDQGCTVAIGDSSVQQSVFGGLMRVTGLKDALKGLDYLPADVDSLPAIKLKLRGFAEEQTAPISSALKGTDAIINLSKFKTHSLTGFTGAVKNFYGLLPRKAKKSYHVRFTNTAHFSAFLVDLAASIQDRLPVWNLMDAGWAMEGDGPNAGDRIDIGLLITGKSPFQVDRAALSMVKPAFSIHTDKIADKLGLIGEFKTTGVQKTIKLKWPKTYLPLKALSWLPNLPLVNRLVPIPKIMSNCIGCGICVKACPADAIKLVNGRAKIDSAKCVRCYTCAEACPHHAIKTNKANLMTRISNLVVR